MHVHVGKLIEEMKKNPYSLLVDGSNDFGVDKLNPLTVRLLDMGIMQVSSQLL